MWIKSKEYIKWVKPQIVYVVSIFGNTIYVVLLLSIEQFWVEFAPTIWQPSWDKGESTTMTPFGVLHYTTFQECACLSVSHFKVSKDFHNIFTYYLRI